MTVTDSSHLPQLLDLVHDLWFDIGQLTRSFADQTVKIYFQKNSRNFTERLEDGLLLIIKNVEQLNIKDTEKVGYYDLNEIKYDSATHCLTITSGIPICIKIYVGSLDIEVGVSKHEGR